MGNVPYIVHPHQSLLIKILYIIDLFGLNAFWFNLMQDITTSYCLKYVVHLELSTFSIRAIKVVLTSLFSSFPFLKDKNFKISFSTSCPAIS